VISVERDRDIRILMAEEQTLLSRERTMHSYMQTGLAFMSVGLVVMKLLEGILYFCVSVAFMILGALLIIESGRRYVRFRRAIRRLREREAKLGYKLGTIR
jgi:uncharacterized membrane protein YidH (DUF202 family)